MKKLSMKRLVLSFLVLVLFYGCSTDGRKNEEKRVDRIVNVPRFNADSAYSYVAKQVAFGPRIPETVAHQATKNYLESKLKEFGAQVTLQEFTAPVFEGRNVQLTNIIGAYNPEKQKRVLLAAHWDTRPFSDKDAENPTGKMDGANDGASGVGVLLEVARNISGDTTLNIGVDIILFDGEDWGEPETAQGQHQPPSPWNSWWCLGSQYWSKNKHKSNYSAFYGILLDMVGAKNSQFFREGASLNYAPRIVEKVWNAAARLGYANFFVKQSAHSITDDHIFLNELGKIPTIDIVHYQPGVGYFGDYHHSQKDNMDLISRETLEAVGSTLLNVIYYEE